ncbi:OmpA family protein [Cognatishimia sp. SS12]|uniref:OmpA family protein n=1 Tax=Cognatishimia sp. SS12 TaxID=2979465 RepID=UPI00233065AD|nr:OmpA family protein [Cognatishimia sp. SS12]MDC0739111.1 OmpA family protein [Cognatishimia sp. SS12]
MRLPLTLTVFATFAWAGILSLAAASLTARVVERSSEDGVQALLSKSGMHWAEAHAEGLNVFLTGTAPTEAERFLAMSQAGTIVDAARVIDNMEVAATAALAAPKFSVEILRSESGISVIGLVPQDADPAGILSRLSKISGDDEALADFMETADYDVPTGWRPAMSFALSALDELQRAKISVSAGEVAITAMVDSRARKLELEKDLRAETPKTVSVSLDISAPRPVITPFTLRAVYEDGAVRFDACSADSEKAKNSILAAAKALNAPAKQDCTIGLGVPSPSWGKASVTVLEALGALGGGTVTISDADISLQAAEGTDPALFGRVVGETEKALPEVFALHAVLPVTDAEGETNLPEFIATLSPEGLMQMRGRLGGEMSQTTINSFAQARFGSEAVYDATRPVDGLPAGWSNRVMTALDALAQLSSGAVTVTPELIEISGKTGNAQANTTISGLLAERLGETQQFEMDVAYIEALDPLANIPTPEECVAQLQAVQEGSKLSFEPGSGTLDAAAAPVLDRIAEILDTCGPLPLEIQGHTDSQGRETMNQALSQNRAQSVLAALRDRRILTSEFVARGYGETTPIADNDTEEGREANRRIEFVLLVPEAESEDSGESALENNEEPVKEDAEAPAAQE